MQNDIMTIENVRGYVDENNVAYLNLEDVARGLGISKKSTKWKYRCEMGAFIPIFSGFELYAHKWARK